MFTVHSGSSRIPTSFCQFSPDKRTQRELWSWSGLGNFKSSPGQRSAQSLSWLWLGSSRLDSDPTDSNEIQLSLSGHRNTTGATEAVRARVRHSSVRILLCIRGTFYDTVVLRYCGTVVLWCPPVSSPP